MIRTRRQFGRLFGGIAFVLSLTPSLLHAGELSLDQMAGYFNSFQQATGRFTQVAEDGSSVSGTLWLKRPGRIRFDYDPPEEAKIIVGGGSLALFDPRSNDSPQRYPLSQTPLRLILDRTVDLASSSFVVNKQYDGRYTLLTLQDPAHPDYGTMTLVFADPAQLVQWIIIDGNGGQTVMNLDELTVGADVNARLFNIIAETRDWKAAHGG